MSYYVTFIRVKLLLSNAAIKIWTISGQGEKIILPPSFIGTKYIQNAIAIANEHHKPDLCVNLTCNPQWPEFTHFLPNQQPQERPNS